LIQQPDAPLLELLIVHVPGLALDIALEVIYLLHVVGDPILELLDLSEFVVALELDLREVVILLHVLQLSRSERRLVCSPRP